MQIKNISLKQLQRALKETNGDFEDNITMSLVPLNSFDSRFKVRLSVKDSRGKGSRIGFTGRRVKAACWHVHGTFFDNVLEISPSAVIRAGTKKIDINGGNLEDWNIGSIMQPMYYSEACDC